MVETVAVVLQERWTLLDRAKAAFVEKTVVDGVLEDIDFPAILEVAVEAVARRIALRKDEATTWLLILNLSHGIVRLEEEMR